MPPSKKLSAVLEFGGKTAASFKKATSAIDKRIDGLGKTISENTKKQRAFQKEMKKLGNRNSGYFVAKRQAAALGKETEKLIRKQKRLQRLSKLQAGAMRRLGKFGRSAFQGIGIAAAGALVGIGKLLVGTAAYGDELAKTAKRQGFTVEGLEKMRFIAERSGVENKVLEKSIQQVQVSIGEAARNIKGPYAQAFKSLGINFRQFDKLDPVEQTKALADAFENVTSQSERTFLAYRLFGGRGTKMLQVLATGREGIDEMNESFDRLGGTIGDKGAASAVKFTDTLTDLKKQVGTTFRLIATEAMPGATGAMKDLTEALQGGDIDIKAIGESLGMFVKLLGKGAEMALRFADALTTLGGGLGDKLAQFFGEGTGPEPAGPLSAATGVLSGGRSANTTNNTSNVYNITQQPGEDGETFARRVAAAQKRNERQERQAGFSSAAAF